MIAWRKRWPTCDVDLAGAAVLVLLLATAWWLVLKPCQRAWTAYGETAAARSVAAQRLEADRRALLDYERQLVHLEQVVQAQAEGVPGVDSFGPQLRQMARIAESADLELLSVAPQPATTHGPYQISEIHVGARGASPDFVRFLDQLAVENPYQSLRAFALSRPAQSNGPCDLSWTMRLYLVPAAEAVRGGSS